MINPLFSKGKPTCTIDRQHTWASRKRMSKFFQFLRERGEVLSPAAFLPEKTKLRFKLRVHSLDPKTQLTELSQHEGTPDSTEQ